MGKMISILPSDVVRYPQGMACSKSNQRQKLCPHSQKELIKTSKTQSLLEPKENNMEH